MSFVARWVENCVKRAVAEQLAALSAQIAAVTPAVCAGMTPAVEAVPQGVAEVLDIPKVVADAVQEGSADVINGIEDIAKTMRRIAPFA